MQDDPSASRLLAAMADTLERRVLTELEGSPQHQVRVVINLCRILERESRLDEDLEAQARQSLALLLDEEVTTAADGWRSLGVQIDARSAEKTSTAYESDSEDPGVPVDDFMIRAHAAVLEIVQGKLAVARPGYDERASTRDTSDADQ